MSVTRIEMLREGTQERVHYKCCPESVMRTLVTMLNFQLLKSPSFIFLALSGFFTLLGMYIPFIYLIERANESNLSRDVSYYLFTALGTSNALGRIISGIITTLPRAKPLLVSYVSLFICGISTIISYFATDVYSQFIYVSVFGLTIGKHVRTGFKKHLQLVPFQRAWPL
jgi:MCP family monocarboxylic acid transporter-like MFS transporter 14